MKRYNYLFILFILFSCTKFEKVGDNFLNQNITRTSFYSDGKIYFSTLEGYNRNFFEKNRYIIYKYDIFNEKTEKFLIEGSSEGRNYVSNKENFFISSSLNPSIIKFDRSNIHFSKIFEGQSYGMWIHQLALKGDFLYFTYSFPTKKPYQNQKIFKLNFKTNKVDELFFSTSSNQAYSGVETVDPNNNIWLWQGFPLKFYWYDGESKLNERKIKINEIEYLVAGWDIYNNELIYVLVDNNNEFKKYYFSKNQFVKNSSFNSLVKLDFNNSNNSLKNLYINENDLKIYKIINKKYELIADFSIAKLKTIYNNSSNEISESPINFEIEDIGLVKIIHVEADKVVFWKWGIKSSVPVFINFRLNFNFKLIEKYFRN